LLTIREEQMEVFQYYMFTHFEDEMVAHSKTFTPQLCKVLSEEQLRVALRQSIQRAETHRFTKKGSVRLYIELMFLCGSDFDTDPQYPMLKEVLASANDQVVRAEKIYRGVLEYQEKVTGPDDINVLKALEALSVFARKQTTFSSSNFESVILQEITRAFPQKAAYVSEKGLKRLIHEGRAEARKQGFSTLRAEALIIIIMFAFGHGCTNDPLYPWISQTLTDTRIRSSEGRADRLERKTLIWLEHVIAWHKGTEI
jgi:hypothetical protein